MQNNYRGFEWKHLTYNLLGSRSQAPPYAKAGQEHESRGRGVRKRKIRGALGARGALRGQLLAGATGRGQVLTIVRWFKDEGKRDFLNKGKSRPPEVAAHLSCAKALFRSYLRARQDLRCASGGSLRVHPPTHRLMQVTSAPEGPLCVPLVHSLRRDTCALAVAAGEPCPPRASC